MLNPAAAGLKGFNCVQCRADDEATLKLLAAIHEVDVAQAVTAERSFLQHLGGGCATPVAAYVNCVRTGKRLRS